MTVSHLSWSSLGDYSSCSHKYWLKRIAKAPQSTSWASIAGRAIHEVTENRDRADFGLEPDPETPGLTFEESFERMIAEAEADPKIGPRQEWRASGKRGPAGEPDKYKENYEYWLANGQKHVDNWRNWYTRSPYRIWEPTEGAPAIEMEFLMPIAEGVPPVKGFIDRVMEDPNGALIVLDIKSGQWKPAVGQLALYSKLLARTMGLSPNPFQYGMFFSTRDFTTKAAPKLVVPGEASPPISLAAEQDGRLEFQFQKAWQGIQQEVFLPSPSNMCSSCDVRGSCFAYIGNVDSQFLPYSKAA